MTCYLTRRDQPCPAGTLCPGKELKESISGHTSRPKIVLDDEYWNFVPPRDDNRSFEAGLNVYEMIPTDAVKSPSIHLKNANKPRIVDCP